MNDFPEKVLLTGGAGFIGSHLCESLVENGVEVVILDEFNDFYDPAVKRANLNQVASRVTVVTGDIRDEGLVGKLFAAEKFDAVFHFAARVAVRPSIRDPRTYFSTNLDGTLNLLEACRENGVKQFIFASSSSVYGVNKKAPFSESDLIARTISPYAASKLAGEQLCSNYSHLHGIRCICLRFFTVYGPRQRPDLAIAKFTRNILAGTPIDQYGDGSTARDYTYVDDIVSGVLAASRYRGSDFEIVNLGGSVTHTLSDLIALIENLLQKKAKINLLPDQPGDVPLTYADIAKARSLLGYSPRTTLEEGVRRYVDWVKTQQPPRPS